jgi:hypothetical protein
MTRARGFPTRYNLRHLILAVALAAVAAWVHVESGFLREWEREAAMERRFLKDAAVRDGEAAHFRSLAASGVPFTPRVGFMPYGPIPVGGSPPGSWEEEARFSADQASLARESAARHAQRKKRIGHRWWGLLG